MTTQQAIEIITNAVQSDGTKITAEQDKALAIVQRAAEKTITRRPRALSSNYFTCPSCDKFVDKHEQRHGHLIIPCCKWCGQALDWGEK